MVRFGKASAALSAAVLCISSAAACGGGPESGAAKKLVVWDPIATYGESPKMDKIYRKMIAEIDRRFEAKHPGVQIDHKSFGYDGYPQRIASAVAANAAPDIAWDWNDTNWKITLPLDDRLSEQQKKDLTLLDQSVVSAKDGKIHVLPWGTYQGIWVYNKKLFQQAGIGVPKTQQDFLGACDALNRKGITPSKVSFGAPNWLNRLDAVYAGQLVGDISKWNRQGVPFNGREYKAATRQLLKTFGHRCWGSHPESKGTPGDHDQAFMSGKSAMLYARSSVPLDEARQALGKDNVGVFLQPALPGGKPNMDASMGLGASIMSTAKNKDLAWKYISFYTEAAQQELAWRTVQQLPNNTKVKLNSADPVWRKLLEWAADRQFHVGAWPVNPEESQAYERMTPDVVTGRMSVDDFLKKVQDAREKTRG
ncbi:ABC transporter substrate-binding protein [Streptomyces tubercidicus]|uniref:ABC transporter substrate-binding protein n=1 Tax=Streptomyces tubercidicus TaxID=47759 RepID=UPI002E13DB52|nr:extracellular solute-binding protein [Streptomyces tubercidicus]WSX24633.1 extracellular solute-binding protein [Streptomyces tubercidicus]